MDNGYGERKEKKERGETGKITFKETVHVPTPSTKLPTILRTYVGQCDSKLEADENASMCSVAMRGLAAHNRCKCTSEHMPKFI